MDRKHINGLAKALVIIPIISGFSGAGAAESQSVLDPAQHPGSPEYQSVFSGAVVPLDSRLSWTQRFNGDESFNSNQVLVQTNSTVANNSSLENAAVAVSKGVTKMDARGVVKAIRESQGKIKIKHGPIDKYGMPGMSMMFKVSDPSSLEGLKKGQNISFNIDNSSGGFVVTRIIPTEIGTDVKQPVAMDAQGEMDSQPKHQIDQGTWFVQLIASRSLEGAEDFWQRIGRSLPALKGKSPRYEKSEDIFRLLVGPGQSSQAARQLCQKLKRGGQDCFIRSIK